MTTGQPCNVAGVSAVPVAPTVPADCIGVTQFSVSTGQPCTNYVAPVVSPDVTVATVPTTASPSAPSFKFTKPLKLGSTGADVLQLQTKLQSLGFYKGKLDGGFGPITKTAVKAFQKAHKLEQVGSVGPLTRAWLNKLP